MQVAQLARQNRRPDASRQDAPRLRPRLPPRPLPLAGPAPPLPGTVLPSGALLQPDRRPERRREERRSPGALLAELVRLRQERLREPRAAEPRLRGLPHPLSDQDQGLLRRGDRLPRRQLL